MQVRLLGPVDAVVGGAVRPFSGLRRKAVLAALALHPGEIVSADRLIDIVWGGQAPATAVNTLQCHVSYLRGRLGVRTAIVARAPGYVLDVAPDGTDIQVADHLIRQGRQCADPARAAAQLRSALALWRGRPLADVAGISWLDEQAERLDDSRLAAVQALVEARLALGEHVQLVPELEHLAQQHPFHEHVHGQLMLALYRAGRQVDALAAYRRLRCTLRAELSVEPGPAVRDLEAAILRQDTAIGPPATPSVTLPAVPAHGAVPAQLPLAVHAFAGRAPEIGHLDAVLTRGAAAVVVSAVSGTAGVGKTALALHWAHRVADRFPDGQLFVNLRGFDPAGPMVRPGHAIRGFLEAFGVAAQRIPDGLDAQAALYRSVLAGKRVLVVLDNARDADQVRPLLPGSAGCFVLVTSRDALTPLVVTAGARPLTVDLLTPTDARDLVARRLGAQRVADEPAAVDEIIARCARLPLALAITAARAATRPELSLAALAAELRAADVLGPFAGGDPATDVRAVFSLSYKALSGPAARLFRLLGPHAAPSIAAPAAASLAGLPQPQVRPLLAELCRAHLLTEHTPGRYTLHDLLRAYATELAGPADQRTALHRLLDHYLHTGHAAAHALHPPFSRISLPPARPGVAPEAFADTGSAQEWFDAELPVLLAAVDTAARNGFAQHAWQLAWIAAGPLDRLGHWRDWHTVWHTALAVARRAGDRAGQAAAHRGLGQVFSRLGRHDAARRHLTRALDLFSALDDPVGLAHAHLNVGQALERDGQLDAALHHSQRALDLYESADHLAGQAFARNAVGWQRALLGDYDGALALCGQALAGLQEIGDHQGEADTWDSLGYAHHHLGDHREAVACYQRALALFVTNNDRYATAATLANLGDSHRAAGDRDAAHTAWQDALTIFADLGHADADRIRAKLRDLCAT